LTLKNKIL